MYSMVIFSQLDDATKIDFRAENYNDLSIKKTPFLLPDALNKKIKILMKELGLCTGSIDMIVSDKDEYIFLEVNPIGQFGMTSIPCNYHIEKKLHSNLWKWIKDFMKENLLPKLKHALKNESDLNMLPATYLFMTPAPRKKHILIEQTR
ncbi:hypothetical protein KUH03_31060 [Sphingobacterium sp. E70]|uniref:hypothetical protein n=1 Tax=Sphingobacterium sp. E70 TaxID=2853439 RepID=UPI00211C8B93|nr:hypothetical protein [Sphingobacterium sp. E70]ULT23576.1 hypothetical protein KUH03_31060 [Sphingobacterium sp. E70]